MRKLKLFLPIFLVAMSFHCPSKQSPETVKVTELKITVGAERLDQYLPLLRDKKVGLLVNQTSMVNKTHLVDTLLSLGIRIERIFAPEHGFRGDHSAGAHVADGVDAKTGLKVTSMYGSHRRPSAEDVSACDVIVFDIQDVGVRFYTYISSMHYMMEACAENNRPFVILDRPNPNGFYVDGPVLEMKYQSFIGMHPVPLVHGLTVGEFAGMINGQGWLRNNNKVDLTVIKCEGYTHHSFYELPVRPSPNLPNMASVYLYPSLGLFEGTNVSIGRGTDHPFQMVGRPNFEKGSWSFTPKSIPGVSDHSKYEGVECHGMFLERYGNTVVRDSKRVHLEWLILFYETNLISDGEYFLPVFDKLAGTAELRKQIEAGTPESEIRKSWEEGKRLYMSYRSKYLLYDE